MVRESSDAAYGGGCYKVRRTRHKMRIDNSFKSLRAGYNMRSANLSKSSQTVLVSKFIVAKKFIVL